MDLHRRIEALHRRLADRGNDPMFRDHAETFIKRLRRSGLNDQALELEVALTQKLPIREALAGVRDSLRQMDHTAAQAIAGQIKNVLWLYR